ncbi:MAG TPA: DUF6186 family protein [Microbacteriaceae bacterium]|nr:DUF6186 family protein [Microbacteriaceae bacterium]
MKILSWTMFLLAGAALVVGRARVRAHHADATGRALFDRAMADRRIRVALIVIWWWLGWHFLAGQTL